MLVGNCSSRSTKYCKIPVALTDKEKQIEREQSTGGIGKEEVAREG
jgi:hypothetical protein